MGLNFACPDWEVHISPAERAALERWWAEVATSPEGVALVGPRPPGFASDEDIATWQRLGDAVSDAGPQYPLLPEAEFQRTLHPVSVMGLGADFLLKFGTDCSCCHAWRVLLLVFAGMLVISGVAGLTAALGGSVALVTGLSAALLWAALILTSFFVGLSVLDPEGHMLS